MDAFTHQELDREVLFRLSYHTGKEHAIERWTMVEKIYGEAVPMQSRNDDNIHDREIRLSIGRLRAEGHLICDLGDGNGRYIAANETEFWEMYSRYLKPIKKQSDTLRAMKKSAARQWPNILQMSLFELETA